MPDRSHLSWSLSAFTYSLWTQSRRNAEGVLAVCVTLSLQIRARQLFLHCRFPSFPLYRTNLFLQTFPQPPFSCCHAVLRQEPGHFKPHIAKDGYPSIFRGHRCPDGDLSKETAIAEPSRRNGKNETWRNLRRYTAFAHNVRQRVSQDHIPRSCQCHQWRCLVATRPPRRRDQTWYYSVPWS